MNYYIGNNTIPYIINPNDTETNIRLKERTALWGFALRIYLPEKGFVQKSVKLFEGVPKRYCVKFMECNNIEMAKCDNRSCIKH